MFTLSVKKKFLKFLMTSKKITDTSTLRKIIFFINYYLKNFNRFSVVPKPFYRILRYNYWKTLIYYTHLRANLFKTKYSNKKFHERRLDRSFNFKSWKYNAFSKRPHLDLDYLVNDILLDKSEKINILDVGCGTGEIGAKLISLCKFRKIKYLGIDFSPSAILKGKKAYKIFLKKKKNISFNFIKKNFVNFDYKKKNLFDYSFSVSVLEMIEKKDINKFIQNLCKKTKKSIFINENNENFPGSNIRDHKFYEKLFKKNGFELVDYKYKLEKMPRGGDFLEFYRLIAYFKKIN